MAQTTLRTPLRVIKGRRCPAPAGIDRRTRAERICSSPHPAPGSGSGTARHLVRATSWARTSSVSAAVTPQLRRAALRRAP